MQTRNAGLRALLQSHAKRTYYATGLLLLALAPLCYVHLPSELAISTVICMVCLAIVSCAFASLQDAIRLSARIKTLFAWAYGIGTVLMMSSWPWLHDLLTVCVRDPAWSRRVGMIDLVFPGMILFPLGAVVFGVLSSVRKWPGRAYLLGGLGLFVLFLGRIWFNLFAIHFVASTSLESVFVGIFWTPVCLVAATAGILIGCNQSELHPSRFACAMVSCYLAGAVLVPAGLYATETHHEDGAAALVPAMVLCISVPSVIAMSRWITSAFGGRSISAVLGKH